ncbi:beta-galactosidase [bacterium]|nr:beta-galactosidase [bacterium]
MKIEYDKYSLIIDGKRTFIRSGAFHYFRSPGSELAQDRFRKLKACGYNTVDIYFYWQYHSDKRGECDFSGIKDVRKVLQAAKDCGLFVIARPGPFINAEVSAGGFPLWFFEDKTIIPRNRVGTEYQYSPKYMELIKEWYDTIIPIINEFDNIILFQIENEYATDEMDEEYMKELYEMARERGVKCPIFHNDAFFAGLWADVVDIYALDLYPYINPKQNWKKDHFCFDTLDNVEDIFRCANPNTPPFVAEMQAGWFDKWDGLGYDHIREALGDEHINIMTKTALSQGVTMFNHYMAVGGTSWGNIASDEVYTSYEFTAPINEYGSFNPNFYKVKEINSFLKSFGLTQTEPVDFDFYEENIYAKIRKDLENDCEWLFIRNLNEEEKTVELPFNKTVVIQPYDMKICAKDLKLYATEIEFSDIEIFCRLRNETEETFFLISDKNANLYTKDGKRISGDKKDFDNIVFEKGGKITRFVFITRNSAKRAWFFDDKIIFDADLAYPDGTIGLSSSSEVGYYDLKYGFSKRSFLVQIENKPIVLTNPKVRFCANEIDLDFDYSKWKSVTKNFDAASCRAFDEFIWYKGKLPKTIKEITLSARHLFAIYINGKEVLSRNSYKIEQLKQVPETLQVHLDENLLTKEENELTILVQNLGFDKGFSGDTNQPRGLVTFETIPDMPVELFVSQKLSLEKGIKEESNSPYLVNAHFEFDIDFRPDEIFGKYLYLKEFPYRRATIFLNGHKIGRFIKRTSVQDKFYLINTFLEPHNSIDIVIWQRHKNILSSWDFKTEIKNVIIEIGNDNYFKLLH